MKKRITVLELIIIAVVLSVFALLLSPRFIYTDEQRQEATIRVNAGIAASAISSVFALKTEEDTEKIAETIADALNKSTKNPLNKKAKAFIVNSASRGAISLVADSDFITINGYAEDTQTPLITQVVRKHK